MNSWEKSDSYELDVDPISDKIEHIKSTYQIGPNDLKLMKKLRNAGTDHRKFMRMVMVYVDITAPLYWCYVPGDVEIKYERPGEEPSSQK